MLLRLGTVLALAPIVVWAAAPVPTGAGQDIAKLGKGGAAACQSCHGASGEGNAAAGFPRLAGLPARYLVRQLAAFAGGQRKNPVMQPIAAALAPDDRNAVAAYYASLQPPAATAATAATAASTAAAPAVASSAALLATQGRWSEQLPACEQCHAPGGRGVGEDFPPLAAQPAAYLAGQLRAWKTGTRPPGPMGLMQVIASKLSDADIEGVTRHYSALPAIGARP